MYHTLSVTCSAHTLTHCMSCVISLTQHHMSDDHTHPIHHDHSWDTPSDQVYTPLAIPAHHLYASPYYTVSNPPCTNPVFTRYGQYVHIRVYRVVHMSSACHLLICTSHSHMSCHTHIRTHHMHCISVSVLLLHVLHTACTQYVNITCALTNTLMMITCNWWCAHNHCICTHHGYHPLSIPGHPWSCTYRIQDAWPLNHACIWPGIHPSG